MIESKYMKFNLLGTTGKTDIYNIISKSSGGVLGKIRWYAKWRQYCFYPSPSTIFNLDCLRDINRMISSLMTERQNSQVKKKESGQ